jgi:uncharacterized protein YbbC (DUF1343 family)
MSDHLTQQTMGQVRPGISVLLDTQAFRPVLSGITLLSVLKQTHDPFAWSVTHFDRLAGSPRMREAIEAGIPPAEIAAEWTAYEAAFRVRAARFLLYPE